MHLEPTSTKRHVRRNVALMVAAVVVAGAVTLGIVLTQGSSQTSAQVTSVDNACQQWLSVSPGLGGDDQWCTDMANWMSQYMGRSGVGPQMMWGNAGQMLALRTVDDLRAAVWHDAQFTGLVQLHGWVDGEPHAELERSGHLGRVDDEWSHDGLGPRPVTTHHIVMHLEPRTFPAGAGCPSRAASHVPRDAYHPLPGASFLVSDRAIAPGVMRLVRRSDGAQTIR